MNFTRLIKPGWKLLVLLSIFVTPLSAQDTLSLQQRVLLLEQQKQLTEEKFSNKSQELDNKIEKEVTRIEKAVDDKTSLFTTITIIAGAFVLLGAGAVMWQFIWGFKKMANKTMKEKLDSHIMGSSQLIIDLITTQRVENQIKNTKKIMVVAGNDEEKDSMLQLLRTMGFKHADAVLASSSAVLPSADLYVFSNKHGGLSEQMVLAYMENSGEEDMLIYYGNRLNVDVSKPYAERVNFSGNKYTLYLHIINTLSFKDVFVTI